MDSTAKVCIICPIGCNLVIEKDSTSKDGYKIKGNRCDRGIKYAINEMTNPTRILTSTVKIKGKPNTMLPVKTDMGIPKDKLFKAMDELKNIEVELPIGIGDIIIKNICNSNANLVATKSISKLDM